MNNSPITIAAGKEFVIDDCKNPIGQYISYVNEIYESKIRMNREKVEKNNVKENKIKHFFFRGQADKDWTLQPKVLRDTTYNEKQLVLDFYHYGPLHSFNYDLDDDRVSLLTDMQHYEVPTRLLDWSLSPLSALYFAVEKERELFKDAVVYVLDPWSFNIEVLESNCRNYSIPKIHDIYVIARALNATYSNIMGIKFIKKYINKYFFFKVKDKDMKRPFAFVSNFTNNRMEHQRGVFTIHGTNINIDLREEEYFAKNACKIIISKCLKKSIYDQLNRMYINEYSQYPDIKGIKEIVESRKGFFYIN